MHQESTLSEERGPETIRRRSFVIISGYHDYRSERRANLHFIADELKKRGEVSFLSIRYSLLSRYRDDPRHKLWHLANRFEEVGGVRCYLWRTPVHPFRLPTPLAPIERVSFSLFSKYLPKPMCEALERADVVFVESGMSIIYAPMIKRMNPKASIIYMASDSLSAIRQAGAIKDAFEANASLFDSARLPSPLLARDLPPGIRCYYIPHGIDKARFEKIEPSPYTPRSLNAVSVGSMLFDPSFFEAAGSLFPSVTFHVIGSGYSGAAPPNVRYYSEMPFKMTLPYLKHCSFAVAAYGQGIDSYLTHTSMKLMQYNYLGIPAVCPQAVVGADMGRFGYRVGDRGSIRSAIEKALASPRISPHRYLSWEEVTDRLLRPEEYEDTAIIS